MNKKYKLIIAGVIGVVILGTSSFFVYRNFSTNKAVEKGIELMAEKEYNMAIASFGLALDDEPNDEETLESKDMIEKYLEAKKLFDEGKTEDANKEVKEISENYSKFNGFKEDVDSLTNQIDESIKKDTEISNNINKVRELVNGKNYDEAKKLIDELEKEKLSEIQKQQIEDLKSVINSELTRIEYEKKAQEKVIKAQEEVAKATEEKRKQDLEYGNEVPYYVCSVCGWNSHMAVQAYWLAHNEGGDSYKLGPNTEKCEKCGGQMRAEE